MKLVQNYGLQGQAVDRSVDTAALAEMDINYKKISTSLGLHRDSFNYFSQARQHNRAQNVHKLRQFYQTIDGYSFLGKQGSQATPERQKVMNRSTLNVSRPAMADPRVPSNPEAARPRT